MELDLRDGNVHHSQAWTTDKVLVLTQVLMMWSCKEPSVVSLGIGSSMFDYVVILIAIIASIVMVAVSLIIVLLLTCHYCCCWIGAHDARSGGSNNERCWTKLSAVKTSCEDRALGRHLDGCWDMGWYTLRWKITLFHREILGNQL